ncbi:ComF family protein [Paeniglutamicibacter sp. R2-26]|uniref:ComF family protein n=1 Tax=Paeniglutamicibacter sp. R2-26 TaxID=3144417 RepID=UPI003EE79E64
MGENEGRGAHNGGWARVMDRLWSAREARILRAAFRGTAALLFPVQCVCCGRPDFALCRACATGLRRAGMRPGRVERHAEALPLDQLGQVLPVIAAGTYEHELAAVLLAYKNHQMVSLGKALAPVLATALRVGILELADPSRPVLLVPLPTRRQARAVRGYWPVGLLLRRAAAGGKLPGNVQVAPLLRHAFGSSWDAAQKGRGRRGRRSVHNTMRMRDTPGARRAVSSVAQVILVDDVLTTGATLSEAHRCLEARGPKVCGAVVLASTAAPAGRGQLSSPR